MKWPPWVLIKNWGSKLLPESKIKATKVTKTASAIKTRTQTNYSCCVETNLLAVKIRALLASLKTTIFHFGFLSMSPTGASHGVLD